MYAAPMSSTEGTSGPAARRVLIVEDNPSLARVLTELLKLEGFHVETSNDGQRALTHFTERGPFDLVLCDVLLPGMRGTEVAHAILRDYPRTGVILWSGHPTDAVSEGLPQIRVLQKPIDADQLLSAVQEVLRESC